MADSLFTKIIKGEIPSYKVYEDDKSFAFLDIHPVQPGHTLVVPKKQVEFLWQLDGEDYTALLLAAKKVANRVKQITGKPYVGMQIIGIDIPHAHIHIIPFTTTEEFRNRPDMNAEPDNKALAQLAARLAF